MEYTCAELLIEWPCRLFAQRRSKVDLLFSCTFEKNLPLSELCFLQVLTLNTGCSRESYKKLTNFICKGADVLNG